MICRFNKIINNSVYNILDYNIEKNIYAYWMSMENNIRYLRVWRIISKYNILQY
jgi:hypothetical protein